jgi:hypothetical protein
MSLIAKIYQDGKYSREVKCGSHDLLQNMVVLYEDERNQFPIAYIPLSMMVHIVEDNGNVDYEKMAKELRERQNQ